MGQLGQGGVIFYVDSSGQHGLVAALTDADHNHSPFEYDTIPWMSNTTTLVWANQNGIGSGFTNTTLITAAQAASGGLTADFAAMATMLYGAIESGQYCRLPNVGPTDYCIGGWYLPSTYELQLLATALCNPTTAQREAGFIPLDGKDTGYWTSTMYTNSDQYTKAYMLDVALASNGQCTQTASLADRTLRKRVRAIRQF